MIKQGDADLLETTNHFIKNSIKISLIRSKTPKTLFEFNNQPKPK
jgi:hypothetical protein